MVTIKDSDISKHRGLIIKIISKWRKYGIPNEDLIAIAEGALMKAYRNYNPAKASFATYASKVIVHELADVKRKYDKLVNSHVYLDPTSGGTDANDLISVLGGTEELNTDSLDAVKLLNKLSGRDRDIVEYKYIKEYSLAEIATLYEISDKRVHQIIESALEKIRTNI